MAVPFRERVLDPKSSAKRPNNFKAERCTFEIVRSGRTLASHVAATSASAITFVVYVICFFLQAGALFAQASSPSSESYEDELRKIQERRQKLEEELSRIQSRPQAPTPSSREIDAPKTGASIDNPAPERLNLKAKAHQLLGVLRESELERVSRKDMLGLASHDQDDIPRDSPILARIAKQAGITVNEWFTRLPTSDLDEPIEATPTESEPSSTASAPPHIPEPSPARTTSPQAASRPLAPAPAIAPHTNAPVAPVLSPAEVDGLLKHGKELFAAGDIAGARSLFLRAAAGNDPSALTALAQTYDPQVLGTMRVRGVKSDPARARAYYEQSEAAQKRR